MHLASIERLEPRALLAAPIVITQGGTYRGTWESTSYTTPAVIVKTTAPVIIENSIVRGPGHLIVSRVDHTNITIRNTKGYGTNPNVYGRSKGRFVSVEDFNHIVLDSNQLEGTAGIHLLNYAGHRTASNTIKITRNYAHNIDGRKSNGKGGYLDFNVRTRLSDGKKESGFNYAQFVQLDKVRGVGSIVIAWNRVVNDPGQSRVEDNISIYKSSGTKTSPIRIHDNSIQGAYTIKPWQADRKDSVWAYDWSYRGGGIMLGDGKGATAADDPGFVKAYGNTIVSTTNHGIALAAGHDLEAYGNRIVSSGKLADGRTIAAQNVGLYIWDSYHAGSTRFYNNSARDNLVGWMKGTGRNDWWRPGAASFTNNQHWVGTITRATELAELTRGLARPR
ncbi:MAG: hypothetical protein ABIP55_04905 [Tepidisphaeraceae bacterium]